jgi:hypothetical protein
MLVTSRTGWSACIGYSSSWMSEQSRRLLHLKTIGRALLN